MSTPEERQRLELEAIERQHFKRPKWELEPHRTPSSHFGIGPVEPAGDDAGEPQHLGLFGQRGTDLSDALGPGPEKVVEPHVRRHRPG
jgi:hypothetical protein